MNKFFFPITLVAVLVIAAVFAIAPVEYAQTTHLPTIGSNQIADGSITSADIAVDTIDDVDVVDDGLDGTSLADALTADSITTESAGDLSLQATGANTIIIDANSDGNPANELVVSDTSVVISDVTDFDVPLRTIDNDELAAGAIPITITRAITTTPTDVNAAFEALGTITLPTFTGAHDVIISVNAEITPGATSTLYLISVPATGGLDCGAGAGTIQTSTLFTTANSIGAGRVTVNTDFFCTGAASGAAIVIGHDSTTAAVAVNSLLITAIAVPT